jgi:chaperone required for assembly of F1-ATPase
MKRFWRTAEVVAADADFGVALDGKPVRTPGKNPLKVPSYALAAAIAAEWDAQEDEVRPATMPLMQLASTAIDIVKKRRAQVVAEVTKYAETDLLCYRAENPPALAQRQQDAWQPLLDWAMLRFDAPLRVTSGVIPAAQPRSSLEGFRRAVAAYDDLSLTALHAATTACGSVVIGLALVEGRLDADAGFAVSQLDESFQIEQWGEDEEAERRRAALRDDIAAAARFLALLRPPV